MDDDEHSVNDGDEEAPPTSANVLASSKLQELRLRDEEIEIEKFRLRSRRAQASTHVSGQTGKRGVVCARLGGNSS